MAAVFMVTTRRDFACSEAREFYATPFTSVPSLLRFFRFLSPPLISLTLCKMCLAIRRRNGTTHSIKGRCRLALLDMRVQSKAPNRIPKVSASMLTATNQDHNCR